MSIHSQKQAGLTIVELMIAMTIGLFVIGGSVGMHFQISKNNRYNEAVARMAEIARYALDTIEYDIRMAGHTGLSDRIGTIAGRLDDPLFDASGLAFNASEDCYQGWERNLAVPLEAQNNVVVTPGSDWEGCLTDSDGSTVDNTDALILRYANAAGVDRATLTGSSENHLVAQHSHGQIFDGAAVPATFLPGDPVYRIENVVYSVRDTSLFSSDTEAASGMRRNGQTFAPLVEDFQIQFGIDSNNDETVDRYVDPEDPLMIGAEILSVRMWVRVRSVLPVQASAQHPTLNYADVTYVPNDNYMHSVFTRTVSVRGAQSRVRL